MIYIIAYAVIAVIFFVVLWRMSEHDTPIERIAYSLFLACVWPIFFFVLTGILIKRFKITHICMWCGHIMGNNESARQHLMQCEKHPYRDWLRSVGFEVEQVEDGRYGLRGHGWEYLPEKEAKG